MSKTLLEKFAHTYQDLHLNNLDSLRTVYNDDVEFNDSRRQLHGVEALIEYLANQQGNLTHDQFHIIEVRLLGESAWITWDLQLAHPKINDGKITLVPGASHLRIKETIYYHRDYFDMGHALNERLPVIEAIIRWVENARA